MRGFEAKYSKTSVTPSHLLLKRSNGSLPCYPGLIPEYEGMPVAYRTTKGFLCDSRGLCWTQSVRREAAPPGGAYYWPRAKQAGTPCRRLLGRCTVACGSCCLTGGPHAYIPTRKRGDFCRKAGGNPQVVQGRRVSSD